MDLYAENILEHFKNPHNTGELSDASIDHQEENLACGDELTLWLKIDEGKITSIGWAGTGCAISQASMSILSDEMFGKTEEEIEKFSKDDIYELLGVPIGPRRFKCALMSLHCVKNAIRKAKGDEPQSWVETVGADDD